MLQPGTQVGGYLIETVLGTGGMSVVYEARQLALDRKVALKILAPHLAADADFRERFRHEGRLQATLDHPHIVTVYEAGELREGLYLAMRLIRGATLKDMILARELDGARTLRLLEPIADALDTAHEAGLIHRDVKPQNILVDRRDHAYLADFGLMKGADSRGMTRAGQVVGTVDYISPEQIRGEDATGASDIYAFTALLYEGFTGAIPFVRASDAAVMYAHLTDQPPRVTEPRPDLPGALDEVIARGMAKNPAERFDSASELIRTAREALGSQVQAVITPPEPIDSPQEAGFRDPEHEVPTQPSPTITTATPPAAPMTGNGAPPSPGETVISAPVETDSAPGEVVSAPEEVAASAPGGETVVAAAGETLSPPGETVVSAPGETVVSAPGETLSPPGETVVSAPGETVVSAPGETVVSAPGETVVSLPGETVISPGETVVSAPAAPAEPPPRRRGRAAPLALATVVAAVAAGAVGYLVGGGSDETQPPPQQPSTVSATTPALTIDRPSAWKPASSATTVPGLPLTDAVSFGPGDATKAGIVAGTTTEAVGASLLPAGFVDRVQGSLPKGEPVQIGDATGLRYRDLKVDGFGDRPLTVYVVPTTAGVTTAACYALPTGKCEGVIGTLAITRGATVPLGADPNYARSLNEDINEINRARRNLRADLRQAKTFRAQANVATRLAAAHRRVANSVGARQATPAAADAQDRLAAALRRAAASYAALARATRQHKQKAYDRARDNVSANEAAVRRAISAFGGLGYKVR